MLGLIKRSSNFIMHSRRKRTLYLSMFRSQFEHCSVIWCPVTATKPYDFEVVQKNAIKWILNEEFISYSNYETYLKKCMDVNILPISKHFDLTDFFIKTKLLRIYIAIIITKIKRPLKPCKFLKGCSTW